jgi:hypothetical protein
LNTRYSSLLFWLSCIYWSRSRGLFRRYGYIRSNRWGNNKITK